MVMDIFAAYIFVLWIEERCWQAVILLPSSVASQNLDVCHFSVLKLALCEHGEIWPRMCDPLYSVALVGNIYNLCLQTVIDKVGISVL
jgi:hypothetical protein